METLARINRFLRQNGAASGMQLAHAGRKASAARSALAAARAATELNADVRWPHQYERAKN